MKILVAGDYITYTPQLLHHIEHAEHPGEIFGDLLPIIRTCDAAIYNQELPLTDCAKPFAAKKAGPLLKSPVYCIKPPAMAGFTHATLATNHIFNYGEEGVRQTIETCRKHGISAFGAGITKEEAAQPVLLENDGVRVALLNFAEHEFNTATSEHGGANPLDIIDNARQIRQAKAQADFVVVIIHGGTDFCPYPSPRMVKQYRYYAEQGATAVIGHHTHVVSGWEIHEGVPILYSIGNLIPGRIVVPGCRYTWPIILDMSQEHGLRFEGMPLKMDFSQMKLCKLTESERSVFQTEQSKVNDALKTEEALMTHWGAFLDSIEKESAYFTWLSGSWYLPFRLCKKLRLLPLYSSFIRNKMTGARGAAVWNLMRCETHRDILGYYYQKYIDRR